jgi:hypothetical protein
MAAEQEIQTGVQADGRKDAIMHRDLTFDTGPTQESAFKRWRMTVEALGVLFDKAARTSILTLVA